MDGPRVYQRGPRWYIDHVDPATGKRQRLSLGRKIATEAQAHAHAIRIAREAGKSAGPVGYDPLAVVVAAFLLDKAERRESRTVRGYRLHLQSFVAHVGGAIPINEVNREHVAAFLRARTRVVSKVTANKELVTLRVFFRWAERADYADANPAAKVDRYSVRATPRTPPTLDLLRAGLDRLRYLASPGARWEGLEQRLVNDRERHCAELYADALELISWTGARLGEVALLSPADLDEQSETVALRSSPRKGPRRIPLAPAALAVLKRRLLDKRPTIFASHEGSPAMHALEETGKSWREREPAYRLVTPHGVRHLVVDRLRQAGVHPIVAARLLGHRTIQMHAHYSHEGVDELREAVKRLS